MGNETEVHSRKRMYCGQCKQAIIVHFSGCAEHIASLAYECPVCSATTEVRFRKCCTGENIRTSVPLYEGASETCGKCGKAHMTIQCPELEVSGKAS